MQDKKTQLTFTHNGSNYLLEIYFELGKAGKFFITDRSIDRQIARRALEEIRLDTAQKLPFSRTLGCACGCSPGYRLTSRGLRLVLSRID